MPKTPGFAEPAAPPTPAGRQRRAAIRKKSPRKSKPLVQAEPGNLAWNPAYTELARRLCAYMGATEEDLAKVIGVHAKSTIWRWKQQHPEFRKVIDTGRDEADSVVAERMYRAATGWEHEAVKIYLVDEVTIIKNPDGTETKTVVKKPLYVPYTEKYPPDVTAGIFWLNNRQSLRWRRRFPNQPDEAPSGDTFVQNNLNLEILDAEERADLRDLLHALEESPSHAEAVLRRLDKLDAEEHLAGYVRLMWPVIEPATPLVWGWVVDCICEHLEAVTDGQITRLLINVPPGSMKSTLALTMWSSWEWGPQNMPHLRYITASYASNLTEFACARTARVINSPIYRANWGSRLALERFGDTSIQNNRTGWLLATSVEGVGTGRRADHLVIDDANNVRDEESVAIKQRTLNWFTKVMPDRLNDLKKSAIVVVQQRTGEMDVSSEILSKELDYVHVCIPAEYDSRRHCATVLGWNDPRGCEPDENGDPDPYGMPLGENERVMHDGDLFWPERFPKEQLDEQRLIKGVWTYGSQYLQSPKPAGGGIIKREWWQLYTKGVHPTFDLTIAVLDTNQSQKEENDFSALVILGTFQHLGRTNVMLAMAWRSKLELNVTALTEDERKSMGIDRLDLTAWERDEIINGRMLPRRPPPARPGETRRALSPMERARVLERIGALGLVDKTAAYCDGYHVDRLLIENKANGFPVESEMRRQFPNRQWTVELIDPEGKDKAARAHSTVPVFSGGLVWAPGNPDIGTFKDYAGWVIDECELIPRGKHDDLADAMIHGLRWLRANNVLLMVPEQRAQEDAQRAYENRRTPPALYPG